MGFLNHQQYLRNVFSNFKAVSTKKQRFFISLAMKLPLWLHLPLDAGEDLGFISIIKNLKDVYIIIINDFLRLFGFGPVVKPFYRNSEFQIAWPVSGLWTPFSSKEASSVSP